MMKSTSTAAVLVAVTLAASARHIPTLPASSFADTEVSTNVHLAAWTSSSRRFDVSLELDATPSNNVQVAMGADSDADGALSSAEAALAIGWDCGEWFLEADGIRTASPASSNAVRRCLSLSLRLGADGAVRGMEASDGAPLPLLSGAAMPAGSGPLQWDTARGVARGVDAADDSIEVRFFNSPSIILAR